MMFFELIDELKNKKKDLNIMNILEAINKCNMIRAFIPNGNMYDFGNVDSYYNMWSDLK